MFTDWTQTDPHYYYARGAIAGVVVASLFWCYLVPAIKSWFGKPNPKEAARGGCSPL